MPLDIMIAKTKPSKQDMMDEMKKKKFLSKGLVSEHADEAEEGEDPEEEKEDVKYNWDEINEDILDMKDSEFEKEYGHSKEDCAKEFWEEFENINGYIKDNKIYEKDVEEDKNEDESEKSSWDKKQEVKSDPFAEKAKKYAGGY